MRRPKLLRLKGLSTVAILLAGTILTTPALTQEKGQEIFSTPEKAAEALYIAAKGNNGTALLHIFGPGGRQIIYSGDDTEDARSRATFLERYEEMHRLVKEPDRTVTLYIGAENWPVPVPIVSRKGNVWYFDTEAGKQEILFRRIGRNELSAMHICRELAAAETEFYARLNHEYAQKIFSDPPKHNGLYWEVADNEPASPIGPLVASAAAEGYSSNHGNNPVPYRGYFFRILVAQGKNAPGGAKNYIVDGKMTEGFAFVAYPAEYRSSGVKTFMVSTSGIVLEKDLGKNTPAIASSITQFNPDPSWQESEDVQENPSSGTGGPGGRGLDD